jgi:hypothetical protein
LKDKGRPDYTLNPTTRGPANGVQFRRRLHQLRRGKASRVACAFLVYMLPPLPRCSSWAYSSLIHPAVSAFPERVTGSACTSAFSGLAQRSLTLRPAHSRGHLFVTRYPKASDISSPPCLLRLLPAGAISPGGACTHWKAPPCHGAHPEPPFNDRAAGRAAVPASGRSLGSPGLMGPL